MSTRAPDSIHQMNPETVNGLQELVQALNDSVKYHREAAEKIDDDYVAQTLRQIAGERHDVSNNIAGLIVMADEKPAQEGTWMGSLRTIWTSLRAGLNSGDPTVVLIEAERAEDVIVNKFKKILPEIAGNPVNDKLLTYYEKVKAGHDRVLKLRNAFQAKS